MVTDEKMDHPKLIDFGLSSLIGEESSVGTPMYSGFENFIENSHISNPKMDVYSLAVTICVMEIGEDRVYEFGELLNFTDNIEMTEFHNDISENVGSFNSNLDNLGTENHMMMMKLKSDLVDNKKEQLIFTFQDFLKAMMLNESDERLSVDDSIYILEKFVQLYQNLEREEAKKYLNII